MRWLASVLILMVFSFPAWAQGHGEVTGSMTFKSWKSECFSDGYCSAVTLIGTDPGAADYAQNWLRIGRHAEQSYWEISFGSTLVQPDVWSDFKVTVDGNEETFSANSEVGAYGDGNTFYFVGEKAQTFMDRLMPGSTVSISFQSDAAVATTLVFQLDGLTAALIWIDQEQGRIGSERVAQAPPYGLVPVYADTETVPDIPTALLDMRLADPECRPFEEIANGRDFTVDEFDADHHLYILPCDSYAYNFAAKVYIEAFGEFYPQYFADYSDAYGWTGSSLFFYAGYDPATRQLMSYYKGRGIGDCGAAGVWEWDGNALRMLQYRAKDECDSTGEEDEEALIFPVVYQAPDYVDPTGEAAPPEEDPAPADGGGKDKG